MEEITYREQIFWGASLDMADEEEITLCYKYVKEAVNKTRLYFSKCIQAENVKRHWLCGNSVKHYPLCGSNLSIIQEHLAEVIRKMVTTNLNIKEDKVIQCLKEHGLIEVYPCNRVFFVK